MEADAYPAQANAVAAVADLVSAYVSNNSVRPGDLPDLIASVHGALVSLNKPAGPTEEQVEKPTPAQIRKSITPDALISFIDGKPYKTLKRHLTGHGFDPHSYRARYGLPADYPTVTANYAAQRSELAKAIGLGQLRRTTAPEPASAAKPKGRGRPRKAAGAAAAE